MLNTIHKSNWSNVLPLIPSVILINKSVSPKKNFLTFSILLVHFVCYWGIFQKKISCYSYINQPRYPYQKTNWRLVYPLNPFNNEVHFLICNTCASKFPKSIFVSVIISRNYFSPCLHRWIWIQWIEFWWWFQEIRKNILYGKAYIYSSFFLRKLKKIVQGCLNGIGIEVLWPRCLLG